MFKTSGAPLLLFLLFPITLTFSQPSKITINRLSPYAVASDTMLLQIGISNQDGLIPGTTCLEATYFDNVSCNPDQPPPVIITDGRLNTIQCESGDENPISQCFENGYDTVKIVLYNALPDEFHKLIIRIGDISANLPPFSLYPAAIFSIQITDGEGNELDTVFLDKESGFVVLYSTSFDMFENLRGHENSNWTSSGQLHVLNEQVVSRVYYDANSSTGTGFIIAANPYSDNIRDSVFVIIRQTTSVCNNTNPSICVKKKNHKRAFDLQGKLLREQRNNHSASVWVHHCDEKERKPDRAIRFQDSLK